MIQITNLSVDFGGVRAVNAVTVNFEEQIVGVIGPNGAGKTTMLNALSGFVRPTSGTAVAFGQDLLSMSTYRRARWGLRRTFQTEQVVEDLNVWDNVAVMLDPIWQSGTERQAQVRTALDYVGLTGSAKRLGQQLNAYERRLVEIGRAIVGRPRIVLMDEPGAGLSETERDELQALITGIPDRFEAIVILVDHDVNLIAATCHSTAVLDFGSLIAYGPTRAVLQDDKVKAAYLGVEATHGQ